MVTKYVFWFFLQRFDGFLHIPIHASDAALFIDTTIALGFLLQRFDKGKDFTISNIFPFVKLFIRTRI